MKDFFYKIWIVLKPPRAYCWQTLFHLSLFSALMSAIARGFVGEVIAIIGYLLLIISIAWLGVENRWQSTPWIVAALICLFLWGLLSIKPQILILLWFPLSAIIASLTNFITRDLEFKFPHPNQGQRIFILLEIQILLACWVQFYFLCNDWLEQYPSLLVEDFSASQFIIGWDFSSLSQQRSQLILEQIQTLLEQQINDRPWIEAQKWLQESDRQDFRPELQKQVLEQLNSLSERSLWDIKSQLSATASGYQLKLVAQWLGPRSNTTLENDRDRAELICDIRPKDDLGQVTCNFSNHRDFTSQK